MSKRVHEDDELVSKRSKKIYEEGSDVEEEQTEYMNMKQFDAENEVLEVAEQDGEVKIEAFNLNEEQEKGRFDKDGNYIENQEEDDEEEEWQNLDEKEIEKAKQQKEKMAKEQRIKNRGKRTFMLDEAMERLYYLLSSDDDSMTTMAKLNRKRTPESIIVIKLITELCELLIKKGFAAYEFSKEDVLNKYTEEEEEGIDQEKKKWYFKWIGDEVVNGPYCDMEMSYWKENYFNGSAVCRMDDEDEWIHIDYLYY